MFDWNDEELTNIIWGEVGESDDHIVPYHDQVVEKPSVLFRNPAKKETDQQALNINSLEQKKPIIKSEHEQDSSSKYDIGETKGFDLDSWPDCPEPSASDATKVDQDSMGIVASDDIRKSSRDGSLRDETTPINKDSEMFKNPSEDGEQSDFVDYGWANVGSFDDLDRMFSNNDPIFGDMSAGNADELWSSSKDITSSPLGPTPLSGDSSDLPLGELRTSINPSDSKAQYMLDPNQSLISGYEKLNEIMPHAPQDVQASIDTIEHSGGKGNLVGKEKALELGGKAQASQKQLNTRRAATLTQFPDKGHKQKRSKKSDKKTEARQLHDLSRTWNPSGVPLQHINVNPCPPLVLAQQTQLPRPFQSAPLAPLIYGNMANHYPAPSVLGQLHPGEGCHVVPPSIASPLKNSESAVVMPPVMTPQEKIEKLRRRQQIRAILAIQKQQLQFGNQVPVSEDSSMEGGKMEVDESLGSFTSLEPNSPVEQDDSNTNSMRFDICSVEESVLYRLQDTIAKLDIRIRLCIRDSLFRLAQSATQRQYPNDTNSTSISSRDEALSNNYERFSRMTDIETDTNPIDRTVAHLLFHRPLEVSGKPAETPESPTSTNLPYERRANSSKNITKGCFPESFGNTQMTSPHGPKSPGIFSEGDQSKNSLCLITSDDAPNSETTDAGQKMIETSK